MTAGMKRRNDVGEAEKILAAHIEELGPGDFAIDCGANVGKVTRMLAESGADVVAFEPDPVVFSVLQGNMVAYPNVSLRQEAVGIEDGEVALLRSPYFEDDPLGESEKNTICEDALTRRREGGWQEMSSENMVSVKLVDLISFVEKQITERGGVSILKMDIEGMEVPILREMDRRGLFDRIGLTIAELHPWRFPDRSSEIKKMRVEFSERYSLNKVNLNWG